jgi:RNA polymerase sigma factor (sigma-70 family)
MANFTNTRSYQLLTKDMRKVKLTKDELNQLHQEYFETKSDVLKNKLITYHLRYLITIVNAFKTSKNVSMEDMIGYGSIGLVNALEAFDPTQGAFTSFAKSAIIRQIITCIQYEDMVRMKNSHKKAVEEGDLPKYTYGSIDNSVSATDDTSIGETLIDDTFDSLFDFDELTHDEKVDMFWDYLKTIMTLPNYYDIARACYSANTANGKAIKVTEEDMGIMFGCTKQNISQKKRIMFQKLREDPKLFDYWRNNFMNY